MWKWLKKLFKPSLQENPQVEVVQKNEHTIEELLQMTKGDLKKLKAQGKIKSIAHPFY